MKPGRRRRLTGASASRGYRFFFSRFAQTGQLFFVRVCEKPQAPHRRYRATTLAIGSRQFGQGPVWSALIWHVRQA